MPAGAELDGLAGILTWTPREDQLGPSYVGFTCTDDGAPPRSVAGLLVFQVWPPDTCVAVTCDSATGCQSRSTPLQEDCCLEAASARVSRPLVTCPEGRTFLIGRNTEGFGRLQNCDRLRVINFLQTGATVRFHVRARCLNASRALRLHARLETKRRLLFDTEQIIILSTADNGYSQRRAVVLPVLGPGPFFEFEGAEAKFSVSLTDVDGITVVETLRVVLTFEPQEDLPEIVDVPPPS